MLNRDIGTVGMEDAPIMRRFQLDQPTTTDTISSPSSLIGSYGSTSYPSSYPTYSNPYSYTAPTVTKTPINKGTINDSGMGANVPPVAQPAPAAPTNVAVTPATAAPAPAANPFGGFGGFLSSLGTGGFGNMNVSDLLSKFNAYNTANQNGDLNGFTSYLGQQGQPTATASHPPIISSPVTVPNPMTSGAMGNNGTGMGVQNFYNTHGYYPGQS